MLIVMSILIGVKETYSKEKEITDTQSKIMYVNMDWWKIFNDEILIEYINKAIQNNQEIKMSTLKVGEGVESKNIIRGNEMPQIGIGAIPALYKLPTQTTSEDLIALPIYANYELDIFGKNRDKTKSMDRNIEIIKENERAVYISIVSAVGSTYYNIVKLDKMIEIQEKIIKDREKIYELMKLSNEEGLVSTADTVRTNKLYIKAHSDLIELKKTREKLLNMMCVLIGDSPENSDEINRISSDDIDVNIGEKIPEYIPTEVIEKRPDYISAEKGIEKAGIDVRVAKKEFLPSFNILGLISFNSTEYLSKMNWTNSLALLGGGVMLPLFTGGKKIANLKLNKNRYEQAVEKYKQTNLKSIQEVNDALCELKLDNEKYNRTLEDYKLEKKDYEYTQLKYEEGIISKLDLLQKREALNSTEKLLIQDKIKNNINMIGLYKATAGGKI